MRPRKARHRRGPARLRPGGFFLNHGIAVAKAPSGRRWPRTELKSDFVGTHVFPDGELVSVAEALASAQRAGFERVDAGSLRPHCALTLAAWVSRLETAKDQATSASCRVAECRCGRLVCQGS